MDYDPKDDPVKLRWLAAIRRVYDLRLNNQDLAGALEKTKAVGFADGIALAVRVLKAAWDNEKISDEDLAESAGFIGLNDLMAALREDVNQECLRAAQDMHHNQDVLIAQLQQRISKLQQENEQLRVQNTSLSGYLAAALESPDEDERTEATPKVIISLQILLDGKHSAPG
jgi:D-ribose pyranose/furanose isomerase RbsD